jgi:citrate lyase subunit beta/citryl-CoA lyase
MVFIPADVTNFKFRRSALFMPASNERALSKASILDCDCVIFDLEDAVGQDERGNALRNLQQLVKNADFGAKETVLRINQLDNNYSAFDLAIAVECGVDVVLLPKVEDPQAVIQADIQLRSAGSKAYLWAMIETPLGLVNLKEIASASPRLKCLVVGPNDLSKASGATLSNNRAALLPWLMQIIATARAFHLTVLDGVYNNFKDHEGFAIECQQGADMGFDGKTLIHPSQIEAANALFGPSAMQLIRANTIIEAFKQKDNLGKGVIQIDGEMVERLHLEQAELLLTMTGNMQS